MKKLFLAIAILFSLNGKAQDTTYYLKKIKLYMQIRQQINNPTQKENMLLIAKKRKAKKDKVFVVAVTTIFTTLSVWFFSGYHK